MELNSHYERRLPERKRPAWLFSVLFHASWIVTLGWLLDAAPRGAADEPGRTTGIVLKRSTAEGDLYEDEQSVARQNTSTADISPERLAAVLPSATTAEDVGRDLPEPLTAGAGATSAGSPPSAAEFVTGGRASAPLQGGQTSVRVFGVEGVGSKFVYVFDRSTSMKGPPLAAAKGQLIQSLGSLERVHQFQIIFFNNQLQRFDLSGGGNRIAFATDRNKTFAERFVGGITAEGGTDRLAALGEAIALRPDVIFFLTDADSPMPQSELARVARLNRRVGASISTIEFGRGPRRQSNNFLTELASLTGGQYGYVDTLRLGR